MKLIYALSMVFLISGCVTVGGLTKFSPTTEKDYPEKPATCDFKIQSTLPDPNAYEEIGTINGCSGTNDILQYKAGIRPKVCKAGGDLVVGQVNGYGVYCISTVFVKK